MKTISIIVLGRVQGVWFRRYALEKALELYLTGYVQNLPDCSVQIIASGTAHQLKQMTDWCYIGTTLSNVTNVEITELELHLFDDFKIVR